MSLWIDPHEVDLTCRERRQPCQNNAQEGLAAGNVKVTYIKFNRQQFLFRNYDIGFSDIADIPKTGDSSAWILWAGVLALSSAALTVLLLKGRRKNEADSETK